MKKTSFLFLALTACANAQDIPNHSVAVGGGPGSVGWKSVGPCSAGVPIIGQGASADPICGSAGAGDVVGPASAVDNSIVTFDGVTGKLIKQNAGPSSLGVPGTAGVLQLYGSTSGYINLQGNPVLGTSLAVLPDGSYNVVGDSISQVLTNKTYNGLTISPTTGTLSIINGKTLGISNSMTLSAGSDGTVQLFPATSGTVVTNQTTAGGDLSGTYPNPTLGTLASYKIIYAKSLSPALVCDDATDNATAFAAITTAISAGGYTVILPSGTCRTSVAFDISSLENVVIQGAASGQDVSGTYRGTTILYTGTGARAIDARNTKSFIFRNIDIAYLSNSFTGYTVDMSSSTSVENGNAFDNVHFYQKTNTGYTATAHVYLKNTNDTTFYRVRFSHAVYGVMGAADTESQNGAVARFYSCTFIGITTAGIINPGLSWSIYGSIFEPSISGAPAGITNTSNINQYVLNLAIYGSAFADASITGTYINLQNVYGMTLAGNSFGRLTGGTIIALAVAGAGGSGISITGNHVAGVDVGFSFTGSWVGVAITGNTFLNVTTPLTGTLSGCYLVVANNPTTVDQGLQSCGAITGTSTSSTALAIGRQGSTNPVFQVDASTASVVTGLRISGAGSGGGVALAAISSASNEVLNIDAKGTGGIVLNGIATGNITTTRITNITNATASTTSSNGALTITGGLGVGGAINSGGSINSTLSQNGSTSLSANNTNAGGSASANFVGTSDAGSITVSAPSTAGGSGGGSLTWTGNAGLFINNANASGSVVLMANTNEIARIDTSAMKVTKPLLLTTSVLTVSNGSIGFPKITASAAAPGAAGGKIELVCGTSAGTAKLIAYAGTSTTATTILDNIGSGVSGC